VSKLDPLASIADVPLLTALVAQLRQHAAPEQEVARGVEQVMGRAEAARPDVTAVLAAALAEFKAGTFGPYLALAEVLE
jgi:hypothetical protein